MAWALIAALPALLLALVPPSAAGALPRVLPGALPQLCVEAARVAAQRHGVPTAVMRAITLVETRRQVGGAARPWPWTLNIEGGGHWFETRAEALARALREIGRGRRSIDLGCFQLNWRWHGQNFASPDAMLEPRRAADYAARFLAGLYAETGDWMRAAGYYHSRRPAPAARYRDLVRRALARFEPADGPRRAAAPEPSASPVPPIRIRPGAGDDGPRPLVVLATAGGAETPGTAHAPGGVALRVFARAAPSWFDGKAGSR